jgi:hypothetical protein
MPDREISKFITNVTVYSSCHLYPGLQAASIKTGKYGIKAGESQSLQAWYQ